MNDIATLRLCSHLLTPHSLKTPREVVAWMGAVQAQDYGMAKWAVGVRLPGVTDMQVENALNRGEIIRTHIMRPTWHIVAVEDAQWLMQLTAPRIKPVLESYDKRNAGLSAATLLKATDIMLRALQNGNHLTRIALCRAVNEAGVALDSRQAAHALFHAELDGLVCSGAVANGKQTYRLLREVAPSSPPLGRDEALAKLAVKYFRSHGPASAYDFAWWSGLTVGEAKRAIAIIKQDVAFEEFREQQYAYRCAASAPTRKSNATFLLPAFDEFLVAYRDRTDVLDTAHHSKIISSNGIFKPLILHNAKVVGAWKKFSSKGNVEVKAACFSPPDSALQKAISKATATFKNFAP